MVKKTLGDQLLIVSILSLFKPWCQMLYPFGDTVADKLYERFQQLSILFDSSCLLKGPKV